MVKVPRNLSAYGGVIPSRGVSRKITDGPCYSLSVVKKLAAAPNGVRLATRASTKDARELVLDARGIADLLGELRAADYIDSEWCEISPGHWLGCDAYHLVRREYNEAASKYLEVEYFLKFGINSRITIVMMVSNHVSR